jgi:hypothetical protein
VGRPEARTEGPLAAGGCRDRLQQVALLALPHVQQVLGSRCLRALVAAFALCAGAPRLLAQDPPTGGELASVGPAATNHAVAFHRDALGRRFVGVAAGMTAGIELYEVTSDDRIVLRDQSSITAGRISRDIDAFSSGGRKYFVVGEESPNFTPAIPGPGARIYELTLAGTLQHVTDLPYLEGVHNQAVCEIGGRVYYFAPSGPAHGGPGVFFFDITDPAQAQLVGLLNAGLPQLTGCGQTSLDAHVHSVTARVNRSDGRAYLYLSVQLSLIQVCLRDYISIYDVTDPARARLVGLQFTSMLGYWPPHSCWPSEDGTRLYATSEYYANPLRVYDISAIVPNDPVNGFRLVREIPALTPVAVYHDAVVVEDELLVVSGYEHGTTVFSIADLDDPVPIAQLDTSTGRPWNSGLVGNWGTDVEVVKDALGFVKEVGLFVGDLQRGLHYFRLAAPALDLRIGRTLLCPGHQLRIEASIDHTGAATANGPFLWDLRLDFAGVTEVGLVSGFIPLLLPGNLAVADLAYPVPNIAPWSELECEAVARVFEPFGCLGLERRIPLKVILGPCP